MPLSGGVTFRTATPGATRACQKPAKRRRGTRHFCDVFLQRLQTNPPVIDGSTKSWNVGGVTTSPETVRRLMQPGGPSGASAPPQGPHHHARRRPGRSPRPDRKELHSRCPGPETGGRPSPICFSPGKDSCTRQAVTGLPTRKELLATPWRNTCEPNWSKTLCKIGGSELPAHQGCDDFSCRV